MNHCVLSIVIATLSQHLIDLFKKHLPDFKGGYLGLRQHAMILGIFALFSSKIACFLWSWQDSRVACDLTDVTGAFYPLQGASRPTELQDLVNHMSILSTM